MPLRACMMAHTERELRMWMIYLDEQWSEPTRTDYYLMQVAQRIQEVLRWLVGSFTRGAHPPMVSLKDQRIRFTREKTESVTQVDQELQTRWAKAKWLAGVQKPRKKYGR